MTTKQKPASKGAAFADPATFGLAGVAINQAAERGQAAFKSGLETWTREAQTFYDQMAKEEAVALTQLQACGSPLEVLGVEQAWLSARSKAYLDSGRRFTQAFAEVA